MRVLCRIEPPAALSDDEIQIGKQLAGRLAAIGKVERQAHALAGPAERHHARRGFFAVNLEHREERALPAFGNAPEQFGNACICLCIWNQGLVLVEAAGAIHPVPAPNPVERVEEGVVMLRPGIPRRRAPAVERVEHRDRHPVEEEAWRRDRPGNGFLSVYGHIEIAPRPAAREDASPEAPAFGKTVDPHHRVRPGIAFGAEPEEVFQ